MFNFKFIIFAFDFIFLKFLLLLQKKYIELATKLTPSSSASKALIPVGSSTAGSTAEPENKTTKQKRQPRVKDEKTTPDSEPETEGPKYKGQLVDKWGKGLLGIASVCHIYVFIYFVLFNF